MGKLTKREKKKAKKAVIATLRFILMIAIGFGIGFGGTYLVRYVQQHNVAIPPEARFASDGDVGTDRFDETTVVTVNGDECTLTYEDGSTKILERVSNSEMKFLNKHLDEATLSWINLGTGACLTCYTIEYGNTRYEFYQHTMYTENVFLYKESL